MLLENQVDLNTLWDIVHIQWQCIISVMWFSPQRDNSYSCTV